MAARRGASSLESLKTFRPTRFAALSLTMLELLHFMATCIVSSDTSNGKNPRCAVVCRYCRV